jgi:hypothetical protein
MILEITSKETQSLAQASASEKTSAYFLSKITSLFYWFTITHTSQNGTMKILFELMALPSSFGPP